MTEDPVAKAQAEAWETNWRQTEEGQRMNSEQVVEMIDAITEGRNYILDVPKQGDNDDMSIEFGEAYVTFSDPFDFSSQIDNPRTAREIAAALIAWADQKEKVTPNDRIAFLETMLKLQKQKINPESHNDQAAASGNREQWYWQNVRRMTPETIERNMQDMKEIQKTLSGGSLQWEDLQKAINICRKALTGIYPPKDSNPNV